MKNSTRLFLLVACLIALGVGLLKVGWIIQHPTDNHHMEFTEFRERSRFSTPFETFGGVSLLFAGLLLWTTVRRPARRQR